MTFVVPNIRTFVLVSCTTGFFVGCGGVRTDYSQVDLAQVRGVLSLDGQPLPNAIIIFETADGTYSYARTNESGKYHLHFNSEKAGVTPGEKVVRVRTKGGLGDADEEEATDAREVLSEQGEVVPACYNHESQLRITVQSGSQTLNFDLKSDGSTTGATS